MVNKLKTMQTVWNAGACINDHQFPFFSIFLKFLSVTIAFWLIWDIVSFFFPLLNLLEIVYDGCNLPATIQTIFIMYRINENFKRLEFQIVETSFPLPSVFNN